jgi:putative hydrolase of HD superfamily
MKDILTFFTEIGKIKNLPQKGLVLRKIKDPALIGEHSFREALMAWTCCMISVPPLNSGKAIKMVLIHDLARGYAGDITPYDPILKKYKKANLKEIYRKWVHLPQKEKLQFFKESERKEHAALKKLTKRLAPAVAREIQQIWQEYRTGTSKEARLVYQLHMAENFLQALEYWKQDKRFPIISWWQQMKETLSNPTLIELLAQIDKKFARELKKI